MLNLLVVFPKKQWETKMSPARRHAIRALQQRKSVKCHLTGQGWKDWEINESVRHNVQRLMPDCQALLWYKPLGSTKKNRAFVEPLVSPRDAGVLTVETYNEAWWPDNQAAKDVIANGTRLVICHHATDMPRFDLAVNKAGCQVTHIPHCASRAVFAANAKPFENRNIDYLLTGAVNPDVYPLRQKWENHIRRNVVPGRTHWEQHPGYWMRNVHECDEVVAKYAALLNRARIHLVCSSKYRYPLAKYVETAMAGAVCMGDMPDQAPPGYEDLVMPVERSWGRNELLREMRKWLLPKKQDQLRSRIKTAHERALAQFTMSHYAEMFQAAVEKALGKESQ